MHSAGSAIARTGRLRLFAAWLWLTLATALFCAMVPAGLPHTASHGSAFNPANSIVALHASSKGHRAILKRGGENDPAPAASAGADLIAPLPDFRITAPMAATAAAPLPTPSSGPASRIVAARFPRGPPAA